MPIEQLKIDDNKAENIRLEMGKIESLKKDVAKQTDKTAIDVIKGLQPTQLATFIDAQFKKDANTYKSLEEMQDNSFYAFIVQAGLDAASTNGRYENLLLGKDGKYGIDDKYGSRTRAAVKQFQTDACFAEKDIDGIVGPKTMEALVKVLKGEITLNSIEPVITGVEVYDESKDIQAYTISIFGEKKELQLNKIWRDKLDYITKTFGKDGDISPVIYKVFDNFKVDDKGNLISAPLLRSKFATTYGLDVNTSFLHQIDFTTLTKTPSSATNVIAGDSAKVSTKTDTVPVATNKFGEEVFDKYVDDIQNRYTLDFIKKIVKNNPIAVSFVDRITELSFTDANPNLTIEYMEENQGRNSYELGNINLREFISSSKKDYLGFEKKIVLLMEEAGKQYYYNKQLDNTIRGKEYTLSQLFPDKSNDDGYKAYFGLFNDGKLLVDKNSQYTKITKADNNKLVLQFDLNDKNLDEDYNKELTIPLEKILVNGKINTDSFELELKAKVKNIIDSNPELFAA